MASQDWMTKDFYAVLGVAKDADATAIKKAYRKLARQYHPDRNADNPEAAKKFKEVSEAYAVLSNEQDRKQYDAIRSMAGGGARFTSGSGGANAGFNDLFGSMFGGGASSGGFAGGTAGADINLDDLMNMFGGYSSPTRGRDGRPGPFNFSFSRPKRGQDVVTDATLEFRDAVNGTMVEITADGRAVKVRIPAGVKDGQKIRLRGKGRPGTDGGDAGDMVVNIKVRPHPVFKQDGKDLRLSVPISLKEAALGGIVEVPNFDGTFSKIKVKPGTSSGTVVRLRGKGAHTPKGNTDLLATLEVAVPKQLSAEARKALEEFDAAMGDADPRAKLKEAVSK